MGPGQNWPHRESDIFDSDQSDERRIPCSNHCTKPYRKSTALHLAIPVDARRIAGRIALHAQKGVRDCGWNFRTCGYGHGAEWWKEFAGTLRMLGYDDLVSIKQEESRLSAQEGLTKAVIFLRDVVIEETPGEIWWI
jgi:hypothetical protein